MTFATTFFAGVIGILALIAGAIYVFGIPREWKRAAEDKALETMGENKASYMLKGQISKLPASDQEDVKGLQKGLGNALGGTMQNPLGKFAGDTADDLTIPLTGR
ncbi:hypothetical protein ANO11243_033880 [Dothideomycetidae sp. 11243]|nr:hypothetical protein ANO11243_033880 [fungal sp. No.11243]